MKLGTMATSLSASLQAADLVFCYMGGLTWDVAAALSPLGAKAQVHQDIDALIAAIVQLAEPQDRIVVMSNGGFGGIHQRLLDALAKP